MIGLGKEVLGRPFVWFPKWNQDLKIKCEKCKSRVALHEHHISRNPEKVIRICEPCHTLHTQKKQELNKILKFWRVT